MKKLDSLRLKMKELEELKNRIDKLQEEIWELEYDTEVQEQLDYERDEFLEKSVDDYYDESRLEEDEYE